MIVAISRIQALHQHRNELLDACRRYLPSAQAEPGCTECEICVAVHTPDLVQRYYDQDVFTVFQRWDSLELYRAYRRSAARKKRVAAVRHLIADVETRVLQPVSLESPGDTSGAGQATPLAKVRADDAAARHGLHDCPNGDDDESIRVLARVTLDEGRRTEFLHHLSALVMQYSRDDGCVEVLPTIDATVSAELALAADENTVTMIERWACVSVFLRHVQNLQVPELVAARGQFTRHLDLQVLRSANRPQEHWRPKSRGAARRFANR